jgi:hypothetical protein
MASFLTDFLSCAPSTYIRSNFFLFLLKKISEVVLLIFILCLKLIVFLTKVAKINL